MLENACHPHAKATFSFYPLRLVVRSLSWPRMIYVQKRKFFFVLFSEMRTCYFILSDCLQSFTDLEELEESELYMCSTCKMKQRSTKKFWIRRLPNVIFLHLHVLVFLEGPA